MTWWRGAVVYQIYPRSYADCDGVGDLKGIIGKLDHLAWLGVDAIWLSPIMPSPNTDWGYDVADYCDVHPELGSLADFDELIAEGVIGGERPNAADFQIATSVRVLLNFPQLRPLIEERPAGELAMRVAPGFGREMPVKLPPEWIPERRGSGVSS